MAIFTATYSMDGEYIDVSFKSRSKYFRELKREALKALEKYEGTDGVKQLDLVALFKGKNYVL